jgi:Helicase HerA, central domain/Type IV secretion-system coupling protein DNA-binding domain
MNHSIPLGLRHTYGGFTTPYHFPSDALLRHLHVLGKTGTGKSTLLQSLIAGLVESGDGFAILDPHGDLAIWALDQIPRGRVEDVVYLDFGDADFVPALNLVSQSVPRDSRPRVASALVAAFRHVWVLSWGPRLEHILYHALRLLLDAENVSLVSLPRLLVDDTFRAALLRQCDDPFIRSFWETEFDAWDKRFRAEAIAPIQNKLGQLVAMPAIRHALGQVRMRVDFRDIMDQGRILIVNLSKGKLGDDASRLLGALLTSMLSVTAMERSTMAADHRRPFYLMMDEAQNFLSDAMASILSESRKFGLGLVFSHQYLDQLTPAVRAAVLGNAGTTVAFTTSGEDAEVLAMNSGMFAAKQFSDLPSFTALMKCCHQSVSEFRLSLSPPVDEQHSFRDSIIARCRDHLCSSREQVEARLNRWLAGKHEGRLPGRRQF